MGDTRITILDANRIGCESLHFDLFIKLGLFLESPSLPETSLGPSRTCTKLSILDWSCQKKTTPCLCYQEAYLKKDCPKLCPISTYNNIFSNFFLLLLDFLHQQISLRCRVATRGRRFAAHDFASQCDLKRWRLGGQTHEGFLSGLSGEIFLSTAVVAVT